jgi:hypothetical protein
MRPFARHLRMSGRGLVATSHWRSFCTRDSFCVCTTWKKHVLQSCCPLLSVVLCFRILCIIFGMPTCLDMGEKKRWMPMDSHVGRSIGRNTSFDLQNRVECGISKLPSKIAVLNLKIQDSYYGRISCKMRPHTVCRIALPNFPLKVSARGNSRPVYF